MQNVETNPDSNLDRRAMCESSHSEVFPKIGVPKQ